MNINHSISILLLGFFFYSNLQFCTAQTKPQMLTSNEIEYIKKQSQGRLKDFKVVLETLVSPDTDKSDIELIIKGSYTDKDRNKIFFNENITVEDDINPVQSSNHASVKVKEYLKNIDLFLEKKNNAITFSNIKTSEVQYGKEYTYIKVFFESIFNTKNSTKPTTQYEKINRVAEIRVMKENNTWFFYITRISFESPNKSTFANPPASSKPSINIPKQRPAVLQQASPTVTAKPIIITQSYKSMIGLKIVVATIGILGTYNAYSLNNNYKNKLSILNDISKLSDPDNDGNIRTPELYNSWKIAYDEAKTAKDKQQQQMVTSLGIAGLAVVIESLLLLRKKPYSSNLSFNSSSIYPSLGIKYSF